MRQIPYRLNKERLADLRRKVSRFEKVILEASRLAAEINSYVQTYAPVQDREGSFMRALSDMLHRDVQAGLSFDARALANALADLQNEEVQVLHEA